MKLLKKNIIIGLRILRIFLLASISLTAFADVQKAENLMNQGNYEAAMEALAPDAFKEDPQTLYLQGLLLLTRDSPILDYEKGLLCLEKAVRKNYAPAMDELAGLYLTGEGVEKNEAIALAYYQQAAQLGYGPSQFNCGIMYKEGQGTEQDFPQAYLYLCLAALNTRDLQEITRSAAHYRDEVASFLSPEQRQDILRQLNSLTLPNNH